MKTLLVGCSFADGDASWAKIIADRCPGSHRVAFPGAGNSWIAQVVQDYVLKNHYDLVLVMWSGYTRLDVPTSWINRRLEKYEFCPTRRSFGDMTLDWISSGSIDGSWSGSQDPDVNTLFQHLYLELDHRHLAYLTLCSMLNTQHLLEVKQIPYFFMTYVNYWDQDRNNLDLHSWYYDSDLSLDRFDDLSYLSRHLDWSRWIFDTGKNGIYERCQTLRDLADDQLHPSSEIHSGWAEKILNHIQGTP